MVKPLFPHPAWDQLAELWESYYPLDRVPEPELRIFRMLEKTIPALVAVLVNHRPAALRGKTLAEALDLQQRQPARLRMLLDRWRVVPRHMYEIAPNVLGNLTHNAGRALLDGPGDHGRCSASYLT